MPRIIRSRQPAAPVRANLVKLEGLLQTISQAETDIANATRRLKEATAAALQEMAARKLEMYETDDLKAERYRPAGRATNTLDPAGFRKLVKDDKEFYQCIKVGMTEARRVVPMKLLDTITTTTPGKPGEETLRVTHKV